MMMMMMMMTMTMVVMMLTANGDYLLSPGCLEEGTRDMASTLDLILRSASAGGQQWPMVVHDLERK